MKKTFPHGFLIEEDARGFYDYNSYIQSVTGLYHPHGTF